MHIFELNSIRHRSSQQIIPKYNRYIEQCGIWKNREYEENLSKRLSSHTSPTPENPEKSTYMLINGGIRHRDQMKRRENQNTIPWKKTVQRKSNASQKISNKW